MYLAWKKLYNITYKYSNEIHKTLLIFNINAAICHLGYERFTQLSFKNYKQDIFSSNYCKSIPVNLCNIIMTYIPDSTVDNVIQAHMKSCTEKTTLFILKIGFIAAGLQTLYYWYTDILQTSENQYLQTNNDLELYGNLPLLFDNDIIH